MRDRTSLRFGWKARLLTLTFALALTGFGGVAKASHDEFRHISIGQLGGNVGSIFCSASADGSRVFFSTTEPLVTADTDSSRDIYERFGDVTTLISAGQINGNGAFGALCRRVSADGSRVFFETSERLVKIDTDSSVDVYQRAGGTTTLISAGQINGNGAFAATLRDLSDDGSRVFFHTDERLVSADTDGSQDVYERSGGTTTRVSTGQINGNGAFAASFNGTSDDGSRVLFLTAERLVSADTDSSRDVYERSAGTTTLISVGQINGNGAFDALSEGLSDNGSRVFFHTNEKLVSADTDNRQDVYERSGSTTTLISAGQINGNGNLDATFNTSSADGSRVFFRTAEPLVSADTDSATDGYERSGGTTTLATAGQINGNGPFNASVSRASTDGSRAFFSTNEQLVSPDTDTVSDIYERSAGTTTLISAGEINGNGAFPASGSTTISDDGSRLFFTTFEQLVPEDTDNLQDVYERAGGTTTLVSIGETSSTDTVGASLNGGVSTDGSRVFFFTDEPLVPADTDTATDEYERSGGTTKLISAGETTGNGPFAATFRGASEDGDLAFFETAEKLVSDDTDSSQDIYRRADGATTRVSAGATNGNGAFGATFKGTSADGSRAFFTTSEQLVAADTDASTDIYQRSADTTTRISAGTVNGNGAFTAFFERASSDGSRVFFRTTERLSSADTDSSFDIYQRSGTNTTQVSIGGNGAFNALFAGASADGSRVFFHTNERLVASDTDSSQDIYTRAGEFPSRVSSGQINGNGAFGATFTGASSDGSRVFFRTAEPLVAADTDNRIDIYQRSGGTTTLVSTGQINGNGAFDAFFAGASADGSRVFFQTFEQLVSTDTDSRQDVYERSGTTTRLRSQGQVNGNGAFDATFTGASADGALIFFRTNEQLTTSDTDTAFDIYERAGSTTRLRSQGQINGNGAVDAFFAGTSADGARVFFETSEQLVSADADTSTDVYERTLGQTTLISPSSGAFTAEFRGASADGSAVFFSTVDKVLASDTDASRDVYGAFDTP